MTVKEHRVPSAGTLDQISYCADCGAPFNDTGPCVPDGRSLVLSPKEFSILQHMQDGPKLWKGTSAKLAKALEGLGLCELYPGTSWTWRLTEKGRKALEA